MDYPQGYNDLYWCYHMQEPIIVEDKVVGGEECKWCKACNQEIEEDNTHLFLLHIEEPELPNPPDLYEKENRKDPFFNVKPPPKTKMITSVVAQGTCKNCNEIVDLEKEEEAPLTAEDRALWEWREKARVAYNKNSYRKLLKNYKQIENDRIKNI